MIALLVFGAIGFSAPAPEVSPLSESEALAVVCELSELLSGFGRNLSGLEPDSVNDMSLFTQAQRRRLAGISALLRAAERDFATVPNKKSREALLEGSRKMREILEAAQRSSKGVEDRPNAVDVFRAIGREASLAAPFRDFVMRQPGFSKPTVGESSIILPP